MWVNGGDFAGQGCEQCAHLYVYAHIKRIYGIMGRIEIIFFIGETEGDYGLCR